MIKLHLISEGIEIPGLSIIEACISMSDLHHFSNSFQKPPFAFN